jgi:hypothetical protein
LRTPEAFRISRQAALWLRHENAKTTYIYADADLAKKKRARNALAFLERVDAQTPERQPSRWTPGLRLYWAKGHNPVLNMIAVPDRLRPLIRKGKYYFFEGSNSGGKRSAAIDSLTGSAKLNGIDQEAYPCHVLERTADYLIRRIAVWPLWNACFSHSADAPKTPCHTHSPNMFA